MNLQHDLNITIPQITRIGIADLADVAEHRTNRVYGSISHHIRFHSGGMVNVVYAADGSLLEFSGEGLSFVLDPSGVLTVKPYCL
jgi:hypothetical protein